MLGALVFTVGGSVFAQGETPEVEVTELPEPAVTREGRGFGPGDGTCDGTCDGTHDVDGDGLPDQLRLQDGTGTGMQYGHGYGPGDGTCDGTCDADGDGIPDQIGCAMVVTRYAIRSRHYAGWSGLWSQPGRGFWTWQQTGRRSAGRWNARRLLHW